MSPELFLMQRRLKKRGTDPKGLEKSRTYTKMFILFDKREVVNFS
jgi:hypothetical protein